MLFQIDKFGSFEISLKFLVFLSKKLYWPLFTWQVKGAKGSKETVSRKLFRIAN